MEHTENYHLKKPEQEEYYTVEDFNENMDIVDRSLKEASEKAQQVETDVSGVKAIAEEIHTKVGATNNTGGSTTTGTVMAKLNKLLNDWTTARTIALDTACSNAVNASARAENARVAAVNAQNYTATNNTASKTGILSQKHAYTHSLLENTTYGLNAMKNDLRATHENGANRSAADWAMKAYQNAGNANSNAANANSNAANANNNALAVNNKIGAATDTEGKTTVFGKLANVVAQLNAHTGNKTDETTDHDIKMNAAKRSLHGLLYRIWWNTGTAGSSSKTGTLSQRHAYTHSLLENASYGLNAIKNVVNTMNTNTARGSVKSVQRGTTTLTSTVTSTTIGKVTLIINKVVPEKCMVLLDGSDWFNREGAALPHLSSLTATTLTIANDRGVSLETIISWQVIEFY